MILYLCKDKCVNLLCLQIPMVSPSPETFSTPPPIYQSSHAADPRPQTDSIDPIQASYQAPICFIILMSSPNYLLMCN